MTAKRSWVAGANDPGAPFPLENLPYGVFTAGGRRRHCGVAIGNAIVDLTAAEDAGILPPRVPPVFRSGTWNGLMALGPELWARLRARLEDLLAGDADLEARQRIAPFLVDRTGAAMHLPFSVAGFTDFYASRHHATRVGTLFRGAEDALPDAWTHMPMGYNGRASSVVVSGTPIRRPWGQVAGPDGPRVAPTERLDFEMELGAVIGTASDPGRPVRSRDAEAAIFGYVVVNDWSARDVQAWEYRPLGPFQSKAAATTVSPWIVPAAALAPFRRDVPAEARPLPYLDGADTRLDLEITAEIAPGGTGAVRVARANATDLGWSFAQMIAHHTLSGCPLSVGDLIASGTVSGPGDDACGCLLEATRDGAAPLDLGGVTRTYLEDGDRVTITARARGDGYSIGFGPCTGEVVPALPDT